MQPTLTNLIEVPGLTHIPSQVHGDKIDAPFEGIEAGYLTLYSNFIIIHACMMQPKLA